MVYSNDPVVLTVKEKNDGDVSLTSPYVMLDSTKLEKTSLEYFGGDTTDDGILDPGEEWAWQATDHVQARSDRFKALAANLFISGLAPCPRVYSSVQKLVYGFNVALQ